MRVAGVGHKREPFRTSKQPMLYIFLIAQLAALAFLVLEACAAHPPGKTAAYIFGAVAVDGIGLVAFMFGHSAGLI